MASEERLQTRQRQLEETRQRLEEELKETERLLSAGQLAYHLNFIHGLLKDGEEEKALAEFNSVGLKDMMILHGYAETYQRIGLQKERKAK